MLLPRATMRPAYAAHAMVARTSLAATGRRTNSTRSPAALNKISAVPFAISPEEARNSLLAGAMMVTMDWRHMVYGAAIKLFGNVGETLAREFGLAEGVNLKSVTPIYYPTWYVDVMTKGNVTPVRGGPSKAGWFAAKGVYVPGNAFAPLSYMSFSRTRLDQSLPLYDPSEDLHQLEGTEIVEIPFDVSPLLFVDRVRREIGTNTQIAGVRINETRWKEVMVAAYPVMLPLYLGHFEFIIDGRPYKSTLILEAHERNGSITPPVPPNTTDNVTLEKWRKRGYYVRQMTFMPHVMPAWATYSDAPNEGISPMGDAQNPAQALFISTRYSRWMSPRPKDTTIESSPTYDVAGKPIEWDDPRIMKYGGDDYAANQKYIETGSILAQEKVAGDILTAHTEDPREIADINASLKEYTDTLEADFNELKPKWLRDYDAHKAEWNKESEAEAAAEKETPMEKPAPGKEE